VENAMLLLHIGYQRVYVNFGSGRLIAADFTMMCSASFGRYHGVLSLELHFENDPVQSKWGASEI
jgi:hypothetical protein